MFQFTCCAMVQGFTQELKQFFRFLWGISVPVANNIIPNVKHSQLDLLFLCKFSIKMRIFIAQNNFRHKRLQKYCFAS